MVPPNASVISSYTHVPVKVDVPVAGDVFKDVVIIVSIGTVAATEDNEMNIFECARCVSRCFQVKLVQHLCKFKPRNFRCPYTDPVDPLLDRTPIFFIYHTDFSHRKIMPWTCIK